MRRQHAGKASREWTSSRRSPRHYVHDLFKFPWPFKTDSVEEVHCSHFFEHIPSKLRPKFMDELYRVVAPEGKVTIICPYFRSVRAIQDFTHEWPPIAENSFLYFNKKWREDNKLTHGHYEMTCDWDFTYGYQMNGVWVNKSEEARNFAIQHYWEVDLGYPCHPDLAEGKMNDKAREAIQMIEDEAALADTHDIGQEGASRLRAATLILRGLLWGCLLGLVACTPPSAPSTPLTAVPARERSR